jgi:hypothetical protein
MRARLNLDLGGDAVLGHLCDDPGESVPGRLSPTLFLMWSGRELRGEFGQVDTVDIPPSRRSDGCPHPAGIRPSSHGVGAHTQELRRLTDSELGHRHTVPSCPLAAASQPLRADLQVIADPHLTGCDDRQVDPEMVGVDLIECTKQCRL